MKLFITKFSAASWLGRKMKCNNPVRKHLIILTKYYVHYVSGLLQIR
jgi:hypothetical protein